MTPSIKLSGNLGERHRYFNSLVRDAHLQNTHLSIHTDPDEPAIERLFKIDVASKQKDVDYIIHTLKDDDMLYVSRALKSLWLLDADHSKIINPKFLETELFPQMITTAVNKMRHWIHMHLRDPQRCEEFYQFYKDKNFGVAGKFLCHCSIEFILHEISNILGKITPMLLKRLSEKVPQTTKIYYDNLKHNQDLLKYYLENDSVFFSNVKYLFKSDADIFFYVLENFFDHEKFRAFSAVITKHIMKYHKSRFLLKPELYTAWFLEKETLAKYLSAEEIKDLVSKLARADYLDFWFSYQNVEPLIKRLSNDERKAFKKLIFVDKAYGVAVNEWPYPIPTPPKLETPQTSLFNDNEMVDTHYNEFYGEACLSRALHGVPLRYRMRGSCGRTPTLLDQLFDKYRFSNYKQTYNELRKQLKAESSPQNRQYMLLVLVSKTGGRTEDLVSLIDLLSQYKNEPVHIRAAIVRSLVKRAFVWRLPSEHWTRVLEWGHGLGLDGNASEAECCEGLHAVVIRYLLSDVKPSLAVWEKFLANFDTLKEYSFTAEERSRVSVRLSTFLLEDAQSDQQKPKLSQLQHLLNTLEAYHMRFDYFPGTVDAVASAVKYYWNSADDELRTGTECLLRRLYDAGVARKRLIKEYFEMNQTDASYVNALRHDTSIIENTGKLEKLIDDRDLKHERFFQKLALYFMGKDGLGVRYYAVLQHRAVTTPEKAIASSKGCFSESETKPLKGPQILARPMSLLSGSVFPSLLETFDAAPPKTAKQQLAAALRANAHLVRPALDLKSLGWRKAGAKAVANRIVTCKECDVEGYIVETVSWRRTLRLALVLAKRVNKEREVFKVIASERPGAALQAALRYFCREGNKSDLSIWEMVKSRISLADPRQLRTYLESAESVPENIKAEYCFLLYLACKQRKPDLQVLEYWAFSKIPSVLAELDEQYIFDTNDAFLRDYFTVCSADYITDAGHFNIKRKYTALYVQTIAKFLVLSTSEEMLEKRLNKIGIPFLKRLELFWKEASPRNAQDQEFLNMFLMHIRYNKAYFNPKCVSCLPVFEKITEWMHGFLPIEKWFEKYVSIHLTMIYYKSVRYCIKQNPELFSEESKKLEGAKMLGTFFGKFLSNEMEELNQKYFPTITKIYAADFVNYFCKYFCNSFDESVTKFTIAILKELLVNKSVASCLLAKYSLEELRNRLKEEYVKDILNKFKESDIEELRFAHDVE